MDTFSKSSIEAMIRRYGNVEDVLRGFEGYDVFILDTGVTIKLPADNSRIPSHEVFLIGEIKLNLSMWELDYIIDNLHTLEAKLN